jgi:Mrp family chromosome partitioning ATPase
VITKDQIMDVLNTIIIPEVFKSPLELSLMRDISISDQKVEITLTRPDVSESHQDWLKSRIESLVKEIEGVESVTVIYEASTASKLNKIGQVIAVMSGKGGVGKSLVTGLAAIALRRQGYSVGILDADITGPSIPKMFGIHGKPEGSEAGMLPVSSETGIKVMSLNLLLPDENEAVIWRGPIIGKVITQFWEEVLWGQLDYLIVDLPPGTADAPLTVMQQLPISGIIIVSSPQDLATMIVKKAVNMAKTMKKPIIGVVENMSYLYVAEINKKIELFGPSRGEEMAKAAGAPLIAQIPIDPELAKLCDRGEIELYSSENIERLGQFISKAPLNCNKVGTSDCKSCDHTCDG